MAITSHILRIIRDGGGDIPEALLVAEAMERGPDANSIFGLVDDLECAGAGPDAIVIAICALAEKINADNARMLERRTFRDEHSVAKDSNRSRRGMPDHKWRALRQVIFERDEWACQYCGDGEDLTCDHIVPLVRGGTNDPDNLATACRSCNSSKGDKLPDEWEGRGW